MTSAEDWGSLTPHNVTARTPSHTEIKSSNVLINDQFSAKVGLYICLAYTITAHTLIIVSCLREGPRHILKVKQTNERDVVPVTDLVEKMLLMNIDEVFYVACMPNIIGRSVLM